MSRLRARLDYEVIVSGYFRLPKLASRVRARWVRWRNPRAQISFGAGSYLGPGFTIDAPQGGTFSCGDGCQFRRGVKFELASAEARVVLGNGCYFTYDVLIASATSVEIGDRVGIGQSVLVTDGFLNRPGLTGQALDRGGAPRPLRIGDDVQVHSKATITGNLGERVIVGANAAIEEDMPPFTVVGGVPARVLDYYGPQKVAS